MGEGGIQEYIKGSSGTVPRWGVQKHIQREFRHCTKVGSSETYTEGVQALYQRGGLEHIKGSSGTVPRE